MESLKLRVTLTNTKGWKETKDVHLNHYLSQKEEGVDVLEKIVEQLSSLLDEGENTLNQDIQTQINESES